MSVGGPCGCSSYVRLDGFMTSAVGQHVLHLQRAGCLDLREKTMMAEMVVEAVSRHDDSVVIKMIWYLMTDYGPA